MPSRFRRSSDTSGVARPRRGGRRWVGFSLAILAAAAAAVVLTRDVAWQERRAAAHSRGVAAEKSGDYPAARRAYETALENHPYDWESHIALADILNHRLGDYAGALRHYLYGLAYSPDPDAATPIRRQIEILGLIRAGRLEDPRDAIEDMFAAVALGAKDTFTRRLAMPLRKGADAYWQAWLRRGRGNIRFVRVTDGPDGTYDATVELAFAASGIGMSLRLQSPVRDLWRLGLGFP